MKVKELDLSKITTRAQAMKALKSLGYTDPGFTMVRGAKTLEGFGVTFTIAPEMFYSTDRNSELTFIPAALGIGNLAAGATAKLQALYGAMTEQGIIPQGTNDLPVLGFAVGLGMLAMKRAAVAA